MFEDKTLRDGDFITLKFLKFNHFIGISTAFNTADFEKNDFETEDLTDIAFMKNKQLYDKELLHDQTFTVNCYR